MISGAVTISPGGTPTVLQGTPMVTNSHPEKVILMVPVLGPVTSPLPLSAVQVIVAFLTVSSVVLPLLCPDACHFLTAPSRLLLTDAQALLGMTDLECQRALGAFEYAVSIRD
jgi:hypothetical protein